MARDAELDRLKAAQDLAYQRKQNSYQAMQDAWNRRSEARDALNQAHDAKQRAYEEQDSSWQQLQAIRDSNGPRIESLNTQQETAFQSMKQAFDSASSAFERRDGASAKTYSEEGHRQKAISQQCVASRRVLVDEIRSARAEHEATKPAFQRAKEDFSSAKRRYDSEKATHERAQEEFKRSKAEFERAVAAFKSRLEKVKAETAKRKESKRAIAIKAGVPIQYQDNVWIKTEPDGTTNLYFGGIGMPDGPGHGHYTMDSRGMVTHRRDPFDPHGAQNFVRDERLERRLSQIALDAFHRDRSSTGPRSTQYDDGSVTVMVKSGYNRKTNTIATDVIVIDRAANPDEHLHVILSEHDGTILFSEWRKNH